MPRRENSRQDRPPPRPVTRFSLPTPKASRALTAYSGALQDKTELEGKRRARTSRKKKKKDPHRECGGSDDRAHSVALLRLVPGPQVHAHRQGGNGAAPGLRRHPHAVPELRARAWCAVCGCVGRGISKTSAKRGDGDRGRDDTGGREKRARGLHISRDAEIISSPRLHGAVSGGDASHDRERVSPSAEPLFRPPPPPPQQS